MARVAKALTCTPEEKSALIQLSRSRSEEARLVERAKIVLLCLDGMRNDEVAQTLSVRPIHRRCVEKAVFRTGDSGSPGSASFRQAGGVWTGTEKPHSDNAGTASSGGGWRDGTGERWPRLWAYRMTVSGGSFARKASGSPVAGRGV